MCVFRLKFFQSERIVSSKFQSGDPMFESHGNHTYRTHKEIFIIKYISVSRHMILEFFLKQKEQQKSTNSEFIYFRSTLSFCPDFKQKKFWETILSRLKKINICWNFFEYDLVSNYSQFIRKNSRHKIVNSNDGFAFWTLSW